MSDAPEFSVVMATYGRGRHILPTVRSVLAQHDANFELLIVGDGCDDETEEIVKPFLSPRVRWLNLPERTGSQAGPNNEGNAHAHGRYIAYIGHDDIWMPDHLKCLGEVLRSDTEPDFAVSGTMYHVAPGLDEALIFGVLEPGDDARQYFFPPSGLAHRSDVIDRIGSWCAPEKSRPPIDREFQLRAHDAGLAFSSTGRITVHKFAAGHRYLSYLKPDSDEQEAMLAALQSPDYAERLETLVAGARRSGHYMRADIVDFSHLAPGQLARENAARKGNLLPPVQTLEGPVCVHQEPGFRALDWADEVLDGVLWKGTAPRPRMLVPFTGSSPEADVALTVYSEEPLAALSIDGPLTSPVALTPAGREGQHHVTVARFSLMLDGSGYTVLTFNDLLPDLRAYKGIGLGPWFIAPATPAGKESHAWFLGPLYRDYRQERDKSARLSEDLRLARAELLETRDQLARARQAEQAAGHVVSSIRNSTSWRITAPLRRLMDGLRSRRRRGG